MFLQTVLTVLSLTALVAALPFPIDIVKSVQKLGARDYPDQYTLYLGDGSTNDGWPSTDQWIPFEDLFNRNQALMTESCSQFTVPNDLQEEISSVYTAVQQISAQTGVDQRFILAIIMQESGGCVRVPTTNWGVRNPGIMQSHNGQGTCNEDSVSTPCTQEQVTLMVNDGAAGTASGDGLIQIINRLGGTSGPAQGYYKTARTYNSGSIAASGNLQDGIATHCYASDVANRLLGWATAPHGCNLD